jgi:diphthine-ammonia ligase
VDNGHEIVALANLYPKDGEEMDSFMYQTVGHEALDYYSKAMGLPLFRREITGKPIDQDMEYKCPEGDEVEDLFLLLQDIKNRGIEFEAISVGAIFSNYQRVRAQHVCDRLGLQMLAFLWERDQEQLLQEMIDYKIEAILIKVAAMGLIPDKHLGRSLSQMRDTLRGLNKEYGINVCGEGGEYETLTLDCPLFKHRLVLEDSQLRVHSNDAFAPVAYLTDLKISLTPK